MVTIGLPVYNGEQWLMESLNSIINQTYTDWELIVTDDGSTDESVKCIVEGIKCIVESQKVKEERIRVIADGKHLGISARINQQVAMARGQYFARMDADDVMLPDRLALQVKYLQEHPEVDVCGTYAGKWIFIHPSVMGKTDWFRSNPYRTECDGCEDWDLWLRTKDCSIFEFIDTPIIYYRNSENFDKKKYLQRRRQGRAAIRMNKGILPWWKYYYLLLDSYLKSAYINLIKNTPNGGV